MILDPETTREILWSYFSKRYGKRFGDVVAQWSGRWIQVYVAMDTFVLSYVLPSRGDPMQLRDLFQELADNFDAEIARLSPWVPDYQI